MRVNTKLLSGFTKNKFQFIIDGGTTKDEKNQTLLLYDTSDVIFLTFFGRKRGTSVDTAGKY